MEIAAKSADETRRAGYQFGKSLKPGDVALLFGDLGSGKTTFTKGLAQALGIKEEITSPTFVFCKKYPMESGSLVHFDCYRIGSKEDAESIGLLEDLAKNDEIIVIEWPENIEEILPKNSKKVSFEYISENERKIIIND